MSNSLWPHGLPHARLPCPSPTPGVYSNSCPLSWWCHLTISSSVIRFFSCPQSFSASGSFPISQFFASGGQSIGVSASVSVLPVNIQDWFPLGWTGWISLQSKGLWRVFSHTTVQKHQFFGNYLYLLFIYRTTCTKVCIPCLYSVCFYITYPASLQCNDLTIRYSYFPSTFALSLSYILFVRMPWTHSALLLFLLEIVI